MQKKTHFENQEMQLHYTKTSESYAASDRNLKSSQISALLSTFCQQRQPINVIELGCGTGRWFKSITGTGTFVGIDLVGPMLSHAKAKKEVLSNNGFNQTEFYEGDLRETSKFTEKKFDLVYSIGVLGYHLPLNVSMMSYVASLLNPQGLFIVTTVQQPFMMHVKTSIKHIFAKIGLPSGQLLSSYACTLKKFPSLAKKTGFTIIEHSILENEALWNGLHQCYACFERNHEVS